MLNIFSPELTADIDTIGFDIDGTLYDEFDFIRQAYALILERRPEHFADPAPVLDFMLARWLEKGSSYPKLFGEAFEKFAGAGSADSFIREAVHIFRNTNPVLTLSPRTEFLLTHFAKHYRLFAVSDGNSQLQQRKAEALGLTRFIPAEHIIFTGDFGAAKPSPDAAEKLPFDFKPAKTLFFGDRDVDADFCRALGCFYIKVYNMLRLG